jgi:nitrate reductase molybdenum cofactor assembly chaperone NarJ/NarW
MSALRMERELFMLFADLLEYPSGSEACTVLKATTVLSSSRPEAAALVGETHSFFSGQPRERAEELFTTTFDLQAICVPYVGFHLFGEGHKRRLFLAGMNAIYSGHNFTAGNELPDHIAVVLRFLGQAATGGEAREIVEDALTPALAKMISAFGDSDNPYRKVLQALNLALLAAKQGNSADGPTNPPESEARA